MDADFEKHEAERIADLRAQNQKDLAAEMAGRENGRIARHGLETKQQKIERKKREQQDFDRAVKSNVAYTKLYETTTQNLHDARAAVYDAHVLAGTKLQAAEERLRQTIASTNKTADGEVVFRSVDGQVYDRNHQTINGAILDGVEWQEDAPSWEEYQERLTDVELHQGEFDRMVIHEERLEKIQAIMDNEESPPSMEELESLNEEITTIMQDTRREQSVDAEFAVQKYLTNNVPNLNL